MNRHVKESFIKYLAGLLDADGSLGFQFGPDRVRADRCHLGLHLVLSSSEAVDRHGFVMRLPELTGAGSAYASDEETKKGSGIVKRYFKWTVYKRADLEMLLPRVIKHMVVKAKHWQWMLDTWRKRRELPYGEKAISLDEAQTLKQECTNSRATTSGPLKPKNHPAWAWLAGYLDGNGHYRSRTTGSDITACCHVNDSQVMCFIQRALGGKVYPHSATQNAVEWRRPLGGANKSFALRILPKLVNHSQLKKHKLEMMIHNYQQRSSESNAAA